MIKVIIADSLDRYNEFSKAFKQNINNGDCQILWQSRINLPEYIKERIDVKNEKIRRERYTAYTALLCSLKLFFGLADCKIVVGENRKPFLKTSGDVKVFFNISHSNGLVAIAISDEGEIGIDLQAENDRNNILKLEKRFLSEIIVEQGSIDADFYLFEVVGDKTQFLPIELIDNTKKDFYAKWTVLESLLKLDGGGFGNLKNIESIKASVITNTKCFGAFDNNYSLSLSIHK